MEQAHHRLRGTLGVDTEFGSFLGDTRIRLLEAIDKHRYLDLQVEMDVLEGMLKSDGMGTPGAGV